MSSVGQGWNPLDWQREGSAHFSNCARVCQSAGRKPSLRTNNMFKAIGLVILLLAIRYLMPAVFSGLEVTLVQFFGVLQSVLAQSQSTMQGASVLMPH